MKFTKSDFLIFICYIVCFTDRKGLASFETLVFLSSRIRVARFRSYCIRDTDPHVTQLLKLVHEFHLSNITVDIESYYNFFFFLHCKYICLVLIDFERLPIRTLSIRGVPKPVPDCISYLSFIAILDSGPFVSYLRSAFHDEIPALHCWNATSLLVRTSTSNPPVTVFVVRKYIQILNSNLNLFSKSCHSPYT